MNRAVVATLSILGFIAACAASTTTPTASPGPTSPAASPGPTSASAPPGWQTHQSAQGYGVALPADWQFEPATAQWEPATDPAFTALVWDRGQPADGTPQLLIAAQDIPSGEDHDQWLCHRLDPLLPSDCHAADYSAKAIGGTEGRFRTIDEGFAAATVLDGRVYLFVLIAQRSHDTAVLFDSILAAITFGA